MENKLKNVNLVLPPSAVILTSGLTPGTRPASDQDTSVGQWTLAGHTGCSVTQPRYNIHLITAMSSYCCQNAERTIAIAMCLYIIISCVNGPG